ncbi:ArsR/SmtB family transcription factor [Jatrophihabitans sp. YIM 134969]
MPFTPGRAMPEASAALFKALAHPARVRVVELLAEREQTIGELAADTGLELSHLSQQVSVLRRAGMVSSRRVRSQVVCQLADPHIGGLLDVARVMLATHLQRTHALLEAELGASPLLGAASAARTVPAIDAS